MIKSFDRFLNKSEPTDPQFFFWLLSWFPDSAIKYVAVLLNSTLSVALGISFYVALRSTNYSSYADIIYIAFLFTPIYFFGSNSRLYGLSARGFGLLLFFLLSWSVYNLELYGFNVGWFGTALVCGFLIWGSNLFAQQAFVGFGILLLIQGYNWMAILLIISTLLFLVICQGYAVRFFKNRYRYLLIYKNVLAKKLLLQSRESVWGDFIYGFWNKKDRSIGAQLYYILANPIIQALIYLPLLPIIFIETATKRDSFYTSSLLSSSQLKVLLAFIIAGIVCFIITSFRGTRFLGEPERYLEIINPFILLVGSSVLFKWGGERALMIYSIIVSAFSIFQLLMFIKGISRASNRVFSDTSSVVNAIQQHALDGEVRLFSNNQDWMKFYLPHNFKMVYYYPTQEKIADFDLDEVMPNFTIIKDSYIERVMYYYSVNYCVIDKKYVSIPISGKVLYEDRASLLIYRH
jgi:hypothetical protein